jgi:hypothetical protein
MAASSQSRLSSRRAFISALGRFAAAGPTLSIGGLMFDSTSSSLVSSVESRRALPRVRVSRDRVIRTVAGLRPFRPTSFVLRVEKLGHQNHEASNPAFLDKQNA